MTRRGEKHVLCTRCNLPFWRKPGRRSICICCEREAIERAEKSAWWILWTAVLTVVGALVIEWLREFRG